MNPIRKTLAGGALVVATLSGAAVGATLLGGIASAQTDTTSSATTAAPSSGSDSSSSTSATPADPAAPAQAPQGQPPQGQPPQGPHGQFDPSKGGHTANGKTEELLSGDTKTQVESAANAAVPGATIERVETDADGAVYEAHMVKSDGSHVTVTFNADYSVVEIQSR